MKPDEIDMERLLQGDKEEFGKMVQRESPRLFRVIVRMLRDDDEAESVMQEAFLQAYKGLDSFRGDSKFTTWLYAIGINLAKASLRKNKRVSQYEEDDIERMQPAFSKGMYVESFDTWDPSKLAEREQRKRIVHDAIDRLPTDYRTIVILRDIEELSTAEAAAILDITEGAARVRLHRARQALRSILHEYFS
ncbi:MAG: sigma-70 family RNA polymerase sigma factor [Rhodothermales bacterium]